MTQVQEVEVREEDFNAPLGLEERIFIKTNPFENKGDLTQGKVFS